MDVMDPYPADVCEIFRYPARLDAGFVLFYFCFVWLCGVVQKRRRRHVCQTVTPDFFNADGWMKSARTAVSHSARIYISIIIAAVIQGDEA